MLIHINGINGNDMVNGEGVSVSLFMQGCPHHCPGCFNPESWDFDGGYTIEQDELFEDILNKMTANGLQRNFSFLGGEPLASQNLALTQHIIHYLRDNLDYIPKIYIWSGYTLQELVERSKIEPAIKNVLIYTYCLIDGPYKYDERDLTLELRGSANQNIIYHPGDYIN